MGRRPGFGARGTAGDCRQISTVWVTRLLRQRAVLAPGWGHVFAATCHDRPAKCGRLVQTLLITTCCSDLQVRTASAGVETMIEVAAMATAKPPIQRNEKKRDRISSSSTQAGINRALFLEK